MFNPFTLCKRVKELEGKVAKIMATEAELETSVTTVEAKQAAQEVKIQAAVDEIAKLAAEVAGGNVVPQAIVDRLNAIGNKLDVDATTLGSATTAGG